MHLSDLSGSTDAITLIWVSYVGKIFSPCTSNSRVQMLILVEGDDARPVCLVNTSMTGVYSGIQ